MPETGLAAAFLAGLASFLSACLLPMVPFALCYLAGSGVQARSRRCRHRIVLAILFSLTLTATFTLLNLGTTPPGQALIRHHAALSLLAALLIGAEGLARLTRRHVLHPALAGVAFAFAWTPCVGPGLSAVLWVAARDTPRGALLLAAYGLGMTLPFLPGPLLPPAPRLTGAALVGFALLLATGQVPRMAGALLDLGVGGG